MWTPSIVGKPRLRVSSRRNDIFSSTKWQLSHAPADGRPPPAPALVMQVPPSGLLSAPTLIRGMTPFGACGSGARTIGLKLILTMLSAKSCSFR
ncbi:hypothetical protein D3C83_06810 [compost metagenome]